MTTAAITIPNPLPAVLVALSSETLAEVAALEASAKAFEVVDSAEAMAAADDVLLRAVRLGKAIETERKRLKAPVLELAQALDAASADAQLPLAWIKTDLGNKLLAYQRAENARREEERRRLEEQRRAAEEAARQAAAEAAAKAEAERKAAADAAPWDEPAAPVEAAPWEQPAAPAVVIPTIEEQIAAAPVKSKSVVMRTAKRVEITDPSLVPDEIAGVALWVIDTKAIERLAKTGVQIPGVTVHEIHTIAAKG